MLLLSLLLLLIVNYIIAFYFIITDAWKLKDCVFLLIPYVTIIIYVAAISSRLVICILDFIDGIVSKEK